MEIQFIQKLYETANDETAETQDRDDARNYLLEHEDEIVAAFLVLPEMPRSRGGNLMFPTYETAFARNCLDKTSEWNSELGRWVSDPASIPDEDDRIGNCLFRQKVAARSLEAKF